MVLHGNGFILLVSATALAGDNKKQHIYHSEYSLNEDDSKGFTFSRKVSEKWEIRMLS